MSTISSSDSILSLPGPSYHMSSFGESKAFKLSDSSAHHFAEYNKLHISRTYPAGRRVDSSNYDPVDMWNALPVMRGRGSGWSMLVIHCSGPHLLLVNQLTGIMASFTYVATGYISEVDMI